MHFSLNDILQIAFVEFFNDSGGCAVSASDFKDSIRQQYAGLICSALGQFFAILYFAEYLFLFLCRKNHFYLLL